MKAPMLMQYIGLGLYAHAKKGLMPTMGWLYGMGKDVVKLATNLRIHHTARMCRP